MKTIVVRTQAELDALPDHFESYTIIEIRSDAKATLIISKALWVRFGPCAQR
jgi:hypothetical protein